MNKIEIKESHPWNGCMLKDINISDNALILVIDRNNKRIVPKGSTKLMTGDVVLMGTTFIKAQNDINLCETVIDEGHEWLNRKINTIDCPSNFLIALIKRDGESFVPHGQTEIKLGDTLVFYEA